MTDGAKLFVNYRRRDAPGSAGRLHDDLARRFGSDAVFRDVSMEYGRDFVQEITAAAGTCHALLAVIGPRWLTLTDKEGRRRLDDPNDYVRLEIETALRRDDVIVIPVLVEDAEMPAPEELPASMRELARFNACTMRDGSWEHDLGKLAAVLAPTLEGEAPTTVIEPEPQSEPERPGVPGWGAVPVAAAIALLAGPVASLLTTDLVNRPESIDTLTQARERIAYYAAERAVVWAVVGAAVLVGWAIATRSGFAVGAAVSGAIAGALGGIANGIVYQGAKYLGSDLRSNPIDLLPGLWLRGAGYMIAGGLIGLAFSRRTDWLQKSEGVAVGAGGALAAAILTYKNFWPTHGMALAAEAVVMGAALSAAAVAAAHARSRVAVAHRLAVPV